jgi:glutathione S-transferase
MKLYGHYVSVTTLQVLTLMSAKRYEPDIVVVDVVAHEQKQSRHLARHPFGHIPVIEDGDFRLYETHAILRYLDSRLPGPSHVPSSLTDRARMDQWLCIEQNYLIPAAKKIMARDYARMMQQPDPGGSVVEEGKRELAFVLEEFRAWIAGKPYIAGDAASLADICWWAMLRNMTATHPLDDSHIKQWWTRVDQRDECKRAAAALAARE